MFRRVSRSVRFNALVFIAASIITLSSCMNDNTKILLQNLETSILESSRTIQESSTTIYESIKNKCSDPSTRELAIVGLQKADSVRYKTERIRIFFSSNKRIINSNRLDMSDGDLCKSLFEQIKIHNNDIASVDSLFAVMSPKEQLKLRRLEDGGFLLFEKNLRGVGETYQSIFLEKLCADALIDEKTLLNRLHNEIRVPRRCVFISPIVGISSTFISIGDSVEITAGIGYFESMKRSKLIVDDTTIYSSENGLFSYKYKSTGKAGRKVVPVKVFYTDMDGNDVISETKFNLTVQ